MKRFALLFFIFVGISFGGCQRARTLQVIEPWARPGFTGGNSAVYFTIDNPEQTGELLLNAGSDAAEFVELHISRMDPAGTMTMEQQEDVPVPAGSRVEFAPGGLHVMLINLRYDLNPGDTFQVVLFFQNRGEMTLAVEVREP